MSLIIPVIREHYPFYEDSLKNKLLSLTKQTVRKDANIFEKIFKIVEIFEELRNNEPLRKKYSTFFENTKKLGKFINLIKLYFKELDVMVLD